MARPIFTKLERQRQRVPGALLRSLQGADESTVVIDEVIADWAYHNTWYPHLKKIARSQKLLAHKRSGARFVSLSSTPTWGFGPVMLVFRRRTIAPRMLVVAYTWRGSNVRLISARKATRAERRQYGKGT